ncbi:MAG: hypothetical protein JRN16_01740 [Nitrososphaerota archaeon]|nr:hypothetical protein [Nitrososphaerota archaeon]MDG6964050.1 hypothetical protein [Nitrososphaerota archaeon]MDG6968268.1 hypothetical protein [Nitrososphaerota archaeon]MDG6975001.1 hypothetical protein [Nitrososphaerota archaeon]MDG7009704.1 hypothetical protein [Nitrososphaerota archaeon]
MKLLPLFLIESVAFLLIIAETYVFFIFVAPLTPLGLPHDLSGYTALALAKAALILGLVVVWFVVLDGLTAFYVRSKVGKTPRPAS